MIKTLSLITILFTQIAFAGEHSVNGIVFNEASIFTQLKDYRGSKSSSACELTVFLTKKSLFRKSPVMKDGRKATCADLTSTALANFVSAYTHNSSALSQLLTSLGNRAWTNGSQDMDASSSENQLECKIYADQIQNTPIASLCYSAQLQGSFSTQD